MDQSETVAAGAGRALPGPSYVAAAAYDARGRLTAWSPGAAKLLGHRQDEVLGRPVTDLLVPDGGVDVRDLLFGESGGGVATVMCRKDGEGVGVELLRLAIPAGEAAATNVLVITPLPDSAPFDGSLAEWAFNQSPFPGGLHDSELRYVRVNEGASRVWGRPAAELLGRTPGELMPTPAVRYIEGEMRKAILDGRSRYKEHLLRMPGEGREHPWAAYYTPLKDAFGRVRGIWTFGFDISAQHRARERLLLLNEASKRVGSTLDVQVTAAEMADVLVPELADFLTVDLRDSVLGEAEPTPGPSAGSVVLRRAAQGSVLDGCPESLLAIGATETFPQSSPHARTVLSGRSYITRFTEDPDADGTALSGGRAASARQWGMHSAMIVPLRARGTTLGVAVFVRHRRPEHFDADDLLLAEEIAARAAVAMDNALRYTRQRRTALTLQNSLLPQRLPQQPALAVAGRYLPSDARIGVGGDWYDVIPLSGARVALVVGDVVGHGIHASATMGRLRTAVRTLADIELPPDELLTHLDDLVSRPSSPYDGAFDDESAEHSSGAGATCLYAVYDPVSRCCAMARAGHPPPVLVAPDGTVELVDLPAGPPLGLGGLPFETREMELAEGSVLALYTDGLVEQRGRDIEEGVHRVMRGLTRPSPCLEEVCDTLLGSVLADRPDGREGSEDDVALLLARTRALDPSRVASWEFPADPAVVGRARERAGAQLDEWGLAETAFTTEIVVSELVTNAIRYADGPIRLRLIREHNLIIEVADRSNTHPRLRRARSCDEGGRGLLLVNQLSRRWGTRATDTGKIVWAEQSVPPAPPAAP